MPDTLTLGVTSSIQGLAAALAVGLLVGLQRGWQEREMSDGSRVAGLRTFALVGLLGGALASLHASLGVWPLAAGTLGFALFTTVSYREEVRASGRLSATSAVAALLTFALGALAGAGAAGPAIAAAVVAAVLLDLKPSLHRWLRMIEHRELSAALQMLVLSVVILPLLPDAGYGPYAALNPYRLWWAVVLIAGLSLAGHIAMRFSGPQRGLLWTGLLGGLASSTAATLALSRRVRSEPRWLEAAAAGILAAGGMMFLRMGAIVLVLRPALGVAVVLPLVGSALVLMLLAMFRWRQRGPMPADASEELVPFDLSTALGFGLFLGVMALLTQFGKAMFGAAGLYGLAALSGLADVDAIVISLARLHGSDGVSAGQILIALATAAATNMVVKATMAWVIGGPALGGRTAVGYLFSAVAGALVAAALWMA